MLLSRIFASRVALCFLCQSVNAVPNIYRIDIDDRDVPPMVVPVILLHRQRLHLAQSLHELQC